LNLPETARVTCWAKLVTAVPLPCCFSTRVRDCCPDGLPRQHRPAASENAPVRSAWPLVRPPGPSRVPAEAVAHVTRRPKETTSCTRGTRWRAGMASSRTRRRSSPIPGTVRSQERVVVWCAVAVVRTEHSRSRSRASSWPIHARSTARRLCPAGAAPRAATPARCAWSAICWPISGR
jgi:hypothetical protein